MSIRHLWTAAVLGAAVTLGGCGGEEPTPPSGTAAPAGTATDVCVVSGHKLGSMGEPVVVEHAGRQVKLCCQACKPAFEKEPDKYLAKLDAPAIGGDAPAAPQ